MQTYYVATDGDDEWSGTTPAADDDDGPFRTIERAQAAVRADLADGQSGTITVRIAGGTYYLDEPLHFDVTDSGQAGHEVVYTNYEGQRPRVVAGRPVTEWSETADGYFETDLDRTANTLYENGLRAQLARYPNEGYLRVDEPGADDPVASFHPKEADLPVIDDVDDLQVYIWPGGSDGHWNWFSDVAEVTEINREDRLVTLADQDRYELGGGSRYAFQGHPDFLDEPGEFYLDRNNGRLRYRPRSEPIDDRSIVVPTAEHAIVIAGSSDDPVRNLRIEGLDVEGTDTARTVPAETAGAIQLTNAEDISIRRCRIRHTGLEGIALVDHCQRITIEANEIADTGHTGISLAGPTSRRYCNHSNRVVNNHIHDVGQLIGHGHGISLSHSGNNVIANNRVHHSPRFGITVSSMPRPTTMAGMSHNNDTPHVIDGIEVSPHDVGLFQHTRNNLIEENDVSHCNLDSQDNGLIYTNTGGRGNIVRANRLHHSQVLFSFGFGLYLDDTSDGVVATQNVIHDLNHEGDGTLMYGIYAKGLDDILENNVVVDNTVSVAPIGSHEHGGTYNRDQVILRNVCADSGPNVLGFSNWSVDRIARSDDNLFYHSDGEYGIDGVPGGYAYAGESWRVETFADWQALPQGYDAGSVCADPQFMAPAEKDYRLRYDSPARELGYQDIDFASIGLRSDYPFAVDEPIERLWLRTDVSAGTPAYIELAVGESAQLSGVGRTATGFAVQSDRAALAIESDDPTVASVDDGTVHAESAGIARITARLDDVSTVLDVLIEQ